MNVRCWIANLLILVSVFVMLVSRIWKVFFIFWVDGLCVVFLTLGVITIIS